MHKYKLNLHIFIKWLSFFMGVFITMPILTIKIAGKHFSIFTLLFTIFLAYLGYKSILSRFTVNKGKNSIFLFTWFYLALISSLFGILYFIGMKNWSSMVLSYIPKLILYSLFLVLLTISNEKELIIKSFFKGFIIGIFINIIWAIIEGLVYYSLGYSLNNRIFSDYASKLPPGRQFITIIKEGGIRAPGFNYDPAHLGGLIPIAVLYSLLNKKTILLVLAGIALIFSQSTTALVASIIVIVFNLKKFNIKLSRIKVNILLINIMVVFIMIPIIYFSLSQNSDVVTSVQSNMRGFANRVSTVYLDSSQLDIRVLYHYYIPSAISFSGIKVITGTGFGTASYPYVFSREISEKIGITTPFPYDPESTYISYLFDIGILGIFIYVIFLLRMYKYYGKNRKSYLHGIIFSSLSGIIFSGLFYHYTLTAYQVIILIMSAVYADYETSRKNMA